MLKKILKFLTSRLFITSFFILLQLCLLIFLVIFLSTNYIYVYIISVFLSLALVVLIVGDDINPTFKVAWIIPMLILPIFGWLLYFVFGRRKISNVNKQRYFKIYIGSKDALTQDQNILDEINSEDPSIFRQASYINKTAKACIYKNTETEFFPTGEQFFEVYLEELEKAEKFIFLEYFIIDHGEMWDKVLEILKRKASQGVDVRVMYDDLGTISLLDKNYNKILNNMGIKCYIFNSFKPSLDVFMNYRDHRKITVIDGNVGFTGGLNLADEYINAVDRFGYWKDCAIMLKGDAVSNLTLMFLQIWYYQTKADKQDYSSYLSTEKYETDGYVQPFGDGPMSGHLTGELAYINLINNAQKYVYISTPYLILDNEMVTALKLAVESGVDVRIITPHIPDKWYVHAVTRSNYRVLVLAGVKIYEYRPGFIHAKTIIADDKVGIVGTVNFDFRSFYLHFENGVFMYKTKAIGQVKTDYLNMLTECIEITPDFCSKLSRIKKFGLAFLNLFSPFM